jgi:hypothetical protein
VDVSSCPRYHVRSHVVTGLRLTVMEKVFAYSLIVNGLIGLASMSVALLALRGTSVPVPLIGLPLPFIGIATGVLALKGKPLALVVGVAFYLVQSVRYYSSQFSLGFTSGFQFGISLHPSPDTTLVVNILAVGFTLFGAVVLTERFGGET